MILVHAQMLPGETYPGYSSSERLAGEIESLKTAPIGILSQGVPDTVKD